MDEPDEGRLYASPYLLRAVDAGHRLFMQVDLSVERLQGMDYMDLDQVCHTIQKCKPCMSHARLHTTSRGAPGPDVWVVHTGAVRERQ